VKFRFLFCFFHSLSQNTREKTKRLVLLRFRKKKDFSLKFFKIKKMNNEQSFLFFFFIFNIYLFIFKLENKKNKIYFFAVSFIFHHNSYARYLLLYLCVMCIYISSNQVTEKIWNDLNYFLTLSDFLNLYGILLLLFFFLYSLMNATDDDDFMFDIFVENKMNFFYFLNIPFFLLLLFLTLFDKELLRCDRRQLLLLLLFLFL
jgi:hypothetical protein